MQHTHSHKSKLWLKEEVSRAAICMELGSHAVYHSLTAESAREIARRLNSFAHRMETAKQMEVIEPLCKGLFG